MIILKITIAENSIIADMEVTENVWESSIGTVEDVLLVSSADRSLYQNWIAYSKIWIDSRYGSCNSEQSQQQNVK